MNTDQFWEIIERINQAPDGTEKQKCDFLTRELKALPPEEAQSFLMHEGQFYYDAYNWELWDAAYLVFGGCGDDSFMDFRHSLIFMGRRIFEASMRDPDSLAEYNLNPEDHRSQSYFIALKNIIKCHRLEERLRASRLPRPEQPSGTHYQPWEMEERFPRLTAKHGHKDASNLKAKERWENSLASKRS